MLWRHFPSVSATVVSIGVASVCNEAISSYLGSVGTVDNVTVDYICNLHKLGNATDFGTAVRKALVRQCTSCTAVVSSFLSHSYCLYSKFVALDYVWLAVSVNKTLYFIHPASSMPQSLLLILSLLSVAQGTGTIVGKDIVACLSGAGCTYLQH